MDPIPRLVDKALVVVDLVTDQAASGVVEVDLAAEAPADPVEDSAAAPVEDSAVDSVAHSVTPVDTSLACTLA